MCTANGQYSMLKGKFFAAIGRIQLNETAVDQESLAGNGPHSPAFPLVFSITPEKACAVVTMGQGGLGLWFRFRRDLAEKLSRPVRGLWFSFYLYYPPLKRWGSLRSVMAEA